MSAPVHDSIETAVDDDWGGHTRMWWFLEGARQAASGPMFIVATSLISVGGLARDSGAPLGVAVLSTLMIWAGPAQVVYFGSLMAHVQPVAIAIAVTLSSLRFLPMCLALLPLLRGRRTHWLTLMFASHFTAMTVWAESMRRIAPLPREARMSFYFGFAFACITTTTVSTAVGYILVGTLPPVLAAGLLFVTPVYFGATLVRNARLPLDFIALAAGFFLMPVFSYLCGPQFDLLVLGVVVGTGAWLIQRMLDQRAGV
jgi:predicted branched-subunit amino acid permease